MKVKCPDCETKFDLDVNTYEEEDLVECPECAATLIVKVKGGKFICVPEREKYEEYSLEEYYDENSDYAYDHD